MSVDKTPSLSLSCALRLTNIPCSPRSDISFIFLSTSFLYETNFSVRLCAKPRSSTLSTELLVFWMLAEFAVDKQGLYFSLNSKTNIICTPAWANVPKVGTYLREMSSSSEREKLSILFPESLMGGRTEKFPGFPSLSRLPVPGGATRSPTPVLVPSPFCGFCRSTKGTPLGETACTVGWALQGPINIT